MRWLDGPRPASELQACLAETGLKRQRASGCRAVGSAMRTVEGDELDQRIFSRATTRAMLRHRSARMRQGRRNGFQDFRRAATDDRERARAGRGRVQAERAEVHGRHLPVGEHEASSPSSACSACRCRRNMAASACRCSTPRWSSRRSPRAATSPRWRCSAKSACRPASSRPMRPRRSSERILPQVVSGDCILAICMTEPHAGTDVANYRTNVDVKGDRRRAQRREDADQPRRRGRHVRRLHPDRPQARPRGHRLRAGRARHAGLRGHRHLSHHGRREPARGPVQRLRAAAGKPRHPRGRLPQAADRVQHPALPQPEHLARARRGRVRRGGALRARAHDLRQADRRVPGHPLEARRHVQGHRGRPQHAVPRLHDRRSVPRSVPRRDRQGVLQRDGDPRHRRGGPDAWRLRLHRRIRGIAALSRRPLRLARRRHVGDAARPDRQAHRRGRPTAPTTSWATICWRTSTRLRDISAPTSRRFSDDCQRPARLQLRSRRDRRCDPRHRARFLGERDRAARRRDRQDQYLSARSLAEDRRARIARHHGRRGVRRLGPRLSRALRRDGGDFARLGVGRPVLRRALESLRQPDPAQRQRGAEAQVPAEADLRRTRRRARDVRAGRRFRRGVDEDARRQEAAIATSSTAPRCGSPTVPSPTRW